jgi:hypothetical protein
MSEYEGRIMTGMQIIFECEQPSHMVEFLKHFGAEMVLKRTAIYRVPTEFTEIKTIEVFEIITDLTSLEMKRILARQEQMKVNDEYWCDCCYHVKEDCDC